MKQIYIDMHHNHKIIQGNYIIIHQLNDFFGHVTQMLLEHFDYIDYKDVVFSVGTYIEIPFSFLQKMFHNKRIIIYQLEQLMGIGTWQSVPRIVEHIKDAPEIWDYDYLNAYFLESSYGIKVHKLVPMLYTKSLEDVSSKKEPSLDVLFYGYLNERRFKIFQKLQSQLYGRIKLAWVYGTFNLQEHIANSKVILNLHAAEPWNRQEQVRMFYPVINGKTTISEISQHNNMPNEIIEADVNNFAQIFLDVCNSDQWSIFGLQAKENFKTRTKQFLKKEFNINTFKF